MVKTKCFGHVPLNLLHFLRLQNNYVKLRNCKVTCQCQNAGHLPFDFFMKKQGLSVSLQQLGTLIK
jgi:hypothetical protein